MSTHTSSLRLFGAVVGVTLLASQACALGGAAPVLISKADYECSYGLPVVTQDCPGAYGLTADGYPVVRDVDGHWVYLSLAYRPHVVVLYGAAAVPVVPAVVVAPQPVSVPAPAPQSVSSSKQSDLTPVVGTPTKPKAKVQTKKARTKKPQPKPQSKATSQPQPKKVILYGTPKAPVQPHPVAPVVPQGGAMDVAPSPGLPPSPNPNKYDVLSPDPSVELAPEFEPSHTSYMITIRPK